MGPRVKISGMNSIARSTRMMLTQMLNGRLGHSAYHLLWLRQFDMQHQQKSS